MRTATLLFTMLLAASSSAGGLKEIRGTESAARNRGGDPTRRFVAGHSGRRPRGGEIHLDENLVIEGIEFHQDTRSAITYPAHVTMTDRRNPDGLPVTVSLFSNRLRWSIVSIDDPRTTE